MFQVVLWSVVPGVVGRGCSVPFSQGEPEFYRGPAPLYRV